MSKDTTDVDYVLGFRPHRADPGLMARLDASIPVVSKVFGLAIGEITYQNLIPLLLNHAMDVLGVPAGTQDDDE